MPNLGLAGKPKHYDAALGRLWQLSLLRDTLLEPMTLGDLGLYSIDSRDKGHQKEREGDKESARKHQMNARSLEHLRQSKASETGVAATENIRSQAITL